MIPPLVPPAIMAILNITPDSFFDGGRYSDQSALLRQTEKVLEEGATYLDIGGASSRPGSTVVSESEELNRVLPAIESILKNFPKALVSIDTWRARVATEAVAAGASLVNDISGGNMDAQMLETVSKLQVPYILMHMKGEPNTMQRKPDYENVVQEVLDYFIEKVGLLRGLGVCDIILDPGFGFGKSVAHNYALLRQLSAFKNVLGLPILVGISRKSMICKPLNVNPAAALNGTTALHMVALQQGADMLRVHDVKEAVEVAKLWRLLEG